MFENGMQIVKADFHMHTIKDKEFKYADNKNNFDKLFIEKMSKENISVGIITNHNQLDINEYKDLKKKGQRKDILILPGVELNIKEGANGIHALIVFNPEEWLHEGNNYIEDFLNAAFATKSNRATQNIRTNDDFNSLLDRLESYEFDYFVILAHVEQRNGFLKECDGGLIQEISNKPLFKKRVIAFQKLHNEENFKKLKGWMGYELARIEGSDCKGLENIGKEKGYTYLKIGELSYNTVKYALLDYKNRVLFDKNIKSHSFINSIEYKGGILDGKRIMFSSLLNTLIGIRGSGKSSIIETIRYGLGIKANQDKDYKDGLIKYILGSGGEIIIEIYNSGKIFKVKRIYGEEPVIFDDETNKLDISIKSLLKRPLYFGQKDLCENGVGYENRLLKLLVGEKELEIKSIQEEYSKELKNEIKKLIELKEIPNKLNELKERYKDLQYSLQLYKNNGIEEKLHKQSAIDFDVETIKGINNQSDSFISKLENLISNYKENKIELGSYKSEYNEQYYKRIEKYLEKYNDKIKEIKSALKSIKEYGKNLGKIEQDLKKHNEEFKEEFANIRREISDSNIDVDNFQQTNREFLSTGREIKKYEKELKADKKVKANIIRAKINKNRILAQVFEKYKEEINSINNSQDELVLNIVFKGNKNSFYENIKENFKGLSLSRDKVRNISEAYEDFTDFVVDALLDDCDKIKTIIKEETRYKIIDKIRDNYDKFLDMETENSVEILYHNKPLEKHSIGQRASALILFILTQKDNDVVIIDQPEDDLDNKVIYDEFIKKLRDRKSNIQFIFATHNPNIPVLGDSERVVVSENDESQYMLTEGTIDDELIHNKIVDIMEGGLEAFNRRERIYKNWNL